MKNRRFYCILQSHNKYYSSFFQDTFGPYWGCKKVLSGLAGQFLLLYKSIKALCDLCISILMDMQICIIKLTINTESAL